MDVKERNWNHCTNHLRDWHGIWTRYTPQGNVKESFQSLRSFKMNPEKTKIAHTNTYMYTNGESKQESWEFFFSQIAYRMDFFTHHARRCEDIFLLTVMLHGQQLS